MADINLLGTINLGKVTRFEPTKSSGISVITFPGEDADKTEGVDTLGISKYISVSGNILSTFETLQDTIYLIGAILDGAQVSGTKFKSPFVNGTDASSRVNGHSGKNTSVTSFKLIDSNAHFQTWGIKGTTDSLSKYNTVKNLLTNAVATITSVDSETQLTLDTDIFTSSGATYAVNATINVKVIDFKYRWIFPGLNRIEYDLTLIQVK